MDRSGVCCATTELSTKKTKYSATGSDSNRAMPAYEKYLERSRGGANNFGDQKT